MISISAVVHMFCAAGEKVPRTKPPSQKSQRNRAGKDAIPVHFTDGFAPIKSPLAFPARVGPIEQCSDRRNPLSNALSMCALFRARWSRAAASNKDAIDALGVGLFQAPQTRTSTRAARTPACFADDDEKAFAPRSESALEGAMAIARIERPPPGSRVFDPRFSGCDCGGAADELAHVAIGARRRSPTRPRT
ncbi:hypothetical protein ACHAWF_008348, partial [Thalassiosira exigua]